MNSPAAILILSLCAAPALAGPQAGISLADQLATQSAQAVRHILQLQRQALHQETQALRSPATINAPRVARVPEIPDMDPPALPLAAAAGQAREVMR